MSVPDCEEGAPLCSPGPSQRRQQVSGSWFSKTRTGVIPLGQIFDAGTSESIFWIWVEFLLFGSPDSKSLEPELEEFRLSLRLVHVKTIW